MRKIIKVSKGGVTIRENISVSDAVKMLGCQAQNIYKALESGHLVQGFKVELLNSEFHLAIKELEELYSTGNKEYALRAVKRAIQSLKPEEDIDF